MAAESTILTKASNDYSGDAAKLAEELERLVNESPDEVEVAIRWLASRHGIRYRSAPR